MLTIKRAKMEDAEEITKIKTVAFNKEINTYLGRDGGPPGYNKVESELEIIDKFLAYKILLDGEIESMHEFEFAEFFNVIDLD